MFHYLLKDRILKFSKNVVKQENNEEKKLLQEAIEIAETFINNTQFQFVMVDQFKLPIDVLRTNMLKVTIGFRETSIEPIGMLPINVLSWVPRDLVLNYMWINKIFYLRFLKAANDNEKTWIRFAVALCILHEMAHFAVKWSKSER